jgi:hydrogenase maturation factor
MANKVTVQVLGGDTKVIDGVETVRDVKTMFNVPSYAATINGDPATDEEGLEDFSFVALSPAVKGGC